jgi:hypothetical protein
MAIKKAKATVEGMVLTIAFAHGEELSVNAQDLPNSMKDACLMHGLKQKLCDAYSGDVDPASAMESSKSVLDALVKGDWSTRAAGEGGSRVTQLAKALSMVTGKALEEAVEVVGNMSDEMKKTLGQNSEIKLAIAQIQAEKAREAAEAAKSSQGPSIADILSGNFGEEAA